ncbi:hypothetical protein F5144DRAFT_329383 [Chaetomium tenue]|uniref:Uncharacterized protein n=1 Tax=Chaetomium tenue TaxID=1854479 RepID=A0ACB7P4F0_9PEZI|nr:hypothetical protein F5144DRAFT_329383 [Chaetomium globosum]
MLVACGGQPRAPDLLHLRCENAMSADRGIFVYGGSVMYLTRSHKAKRSTNREFYVARFLPVQPGHLIFKYLVYIRPVVDMLMREQRPGLRGCSTYLFRAKASDDSEAWTTGHLTNVIKRFSAQAWGKGITLQMLRQLSVGISEKHVREVFKPFNRFDDLTDAADRNVAFAWQTGHRPLQRARSYGLDGAFPAQLQPQLLGRYVWVSSRWHEFLHLPSTVAPPAAPKTGTGAGGAGIDDCERGPLAGGRNAHSYELTPAVPHTPIVAPVRGEKRRLAPAPAPGLPPRSSGDRGDRKRPAGPEQGAAQSKRTRLADPSPPPPPTRPVSARADEPLFGRLNAAAAVEEAEERRRIVAYLAGKLPIVHSINSKDTKLVITAEHGGKRTGEADSPPHPSYQTTRRLGKIHKRTEEWRFVGCELCFATTGQREPDHGLEDCGRWETSETARRLLRWLEGLSIPRYYGWRGACAICGHGWVVCDEMRMQFQLEEAASRQPEDRARLAAQYDSAQGRDGFCGNRPVVRRMMAALLAYDDQILGKVLTRLVLDHSGVDLGSEKEAKGWFEQRVRSTDGYWSPRQLHALDLLILAFDWRLEQRRSPEAATAGSPELAWDNGPEVENWRGALDWLRGRCSFCAGRGLGEGQIRHALRQCHRGGAQKVREDMGDLLYGRDYEPAGGCYVCHLPKDFCSRWEDQGGGGPWIERRDGACSYDRNFLYDGVVGFWTCGVAAYKEELLEEIDDYFMDQGEDLPRYHDDENAVSWLTQPLFVAAARAIKEKNAARLGGRVR